MALNITSREGWHANSSIRAVDMLRPPVTKVFLMNTHTKPCRNSVYCQGVVRRLQNFHTEIQRQSDIRYNFMIGGDGSVYEGRGWDGYPELPREYKTMNKQSISISYIGPYTADTLPKNMSDVSSALVKHGVKNGLISEDFELHDIMLKDEPRSPDEIEESMSNYT